MRSIAGYALLLAGVAGCLLPIVPGIPFLIGGAAILGWDHWAVRPWAQHLHRWRVPFVPKPETRPQPSPESDTNPNRTSGNNR